MEAEGKCAGGFHASFFSLSVTEISSHPSTHFPSLFSTETKLLAVAMSHTVDYISQHSVGSDNSITRWAGESHQGR